MNRTLALFAVTLLLLGCTRYSTRGTGPFARRPKSEPFAAIPPGPPANNSPLALNSNAQPEPPQPPNVDLVVPPRTSEPKAAVAQLPEHPSDVLPASGSVPAEDGNLPPRRRPDPQPQPKEQQPPPPAAETPQAAAARNISETKKLLAVATEKWNTVDTYESTVTRRELAPNNTRTDEVVFYQFRKEPLAVYIRNIGEAGKGREVVYNPSKHGDLVHTILGQGDGKLGFKPGDRGPALTPDSAFVKNKSRYSIREAGFGFPISRVAGWLAKVEAGKLPADSLTYLGAVQRPEFPQPVAGVQIKLRPGDDPLMPNGGTRLWFFDRDPQSPACGLPLLIIATEPNGKDVEYYLFEKVKFGTKYPEMDFSPDRFPKKR
ncbi:MAG: DUF1571 domain-containing protein [Gemmataceae bacterium]